MDSDLPAVVITLVISALILFVGVYAVSGVIQTQDSPTGDTQAAPYLDGTNFVDLPGPSGTGETVYNSRGKAVKLSGYNDSYIQSTEDIDVQSQSSWTISVWASRDVSTTESMTTLSIDGEIIVSYNGSSGNWSAWYYDVGSTASYRVNVSTTANPDELENIVVTKDPDGFEIFANDTNRAWTAIDGNSTSPHPSGGNWDGRLEELRFHTEAWNRTQVTDHYQNPIAPTTQSRFGRVMFDRPGAEYQRLYWHAGKISTFNATFAAGIPGSEMTPSSALLQQSDYEWRTNGPQIRAIDGGELENAPVAFVSYTATDATNQLQEQFTSAVGLAGLLLVLLPLVVIVGYLYTVRSGR